MPCAWKWMSDGKQDVGQYSSSSIFCPCLNVYWGCAKFSPHVWLYVSVYMWVFVWVCMCECYSVVIQSPMHVCIDQQAWSHRQQSLNLITDVFLCKTVFTAQNEQNEFTAIGTEIWNSDCEFHIGTEDWLSIKYEVWHSCSCLFLLDLQTLQKTS